MTEDEMSGPVVFITTYAIKDGELERFRSLLRDLLDALEAEDPDALAVNAYIDADGTEASIVQLMPDAESIKDFWRILHQRTGRSLGDFAGTTGVQVYGSLGNIAIERTRHSAGSTAVVTVLPQHVGGFTRLRQTDSARP
jgi:erythromycin esterase-like protein